jgi:hypothetical protein
MFLVIIILFIIGVNYCEYAHGTGCYQFTVKDIDESLENVYETISEGNRVHLIFKSDGGYVSVADSMIEAIKGNPKVTGEIIDCSSACVSIAAAIGVDNLKVSTFSKIGLHAPYTVDLRGKRAPLDDYEYYKDLYNVFEAGGLNAPMLVGITIGTPSRGVHFLTVDEMRQAGFIINE